MSQLRAVVVDDDADIRLLLRRTLEMQGFAVYEAASGSEALVSIQENSPDLVTLDLNLPDLDGVEVCRRMRKFSEAYVVMITARADEIDELIGLETGADDYISKPFSPRTVQARVSAVLRRHRPTPQRPTPQRRATDFMPGGRRIISRDARHAAPPGKRCRGDDRRRVRCADASAAPGERRCARQPDRQPGPRADRRARRSRSRPPS